MPTIRHGPPATIMPRLGCWYGVPRLALLLLAVLALAEDTIAQTSTSPDSSASTSSTSSTPTSGSSGGGGGQFTVGSASYFFGFIITFVVLLVVFVGCGFGARRRRRGALFWDPRRGVIWDDPDADKDERKNMERPVFWEVCGRPLAPESAVSQGQGEKAGDGGEATIYEKRNDGERKWMWGDIQPLSATLTRPPPPLPPPPSIDSSAPGESRPPIIEHFRGAIFGTAPEPRSRLSFRKKRPPPEPDPGAPPEAVRVAVLIAMPAPPKQHAKSLSQGDGAGPSSSNGEGDALGVFQLGTAELPWSHGELDAS